MTAPERKKDDEAKSATVRENADQRRKYLTDGEYSFPAFDRANVAPRTRMHYGGRLNLPDDLRQKIEKNDLVARWVSVDEAGRYDELVGSGVYAPLMKNGEAVSRPAGGGGRMQLMVTAREIAEASAAAAQSRILDPLQHKKGRYVDPATGQSREIDLDADPRQGEYAPTGDVAKIDSPLR